MNKTKTSNPFDAIYQRLQVLNFHKSYVKEIGLPDWWNDEIALNKTGFAQGLLYISRRLGVDYTSLADAHTEVRLIDSGLCKFKRHVDSQSQEYKLPQVMAKRVAQMCVTGVDPIERPIRCSAKDVRDKILGTGARWVGLSELVDFIWQLGIPILHLDHFPRKTKSPDGFALDIDGHPAIVICKNTKFPAWLLFILAHELGHICSGHLGRNEAILDEKFEAGQRTTDSEEQEANEFAVEVLTGSKTSPVRIPAQRMTSETLAQKAAHLGALYKINPGHLALSYAYGRKGICYAVSQGALKFLESPNGIVILKDFLEKKLDWSRLSQDNFDFLMKISA